MKCSKCGSEWNVNASFESKIKTCPFCNSLLTYDYNAQKPSKLNEDENCVQKNRDGSYTEGKKKNGIWEGPFKKTYKDGSYYKGTFINGEIRGEVTYISIDG